jgi:glycosyltransferase involved in cell wall biosynthesis
MSSALDSIAAEHHGAVSRVLLSKPVAPSGIEALGRTHYSYGFAARNFNRMLTEAGVTITTIVHPEQFKSDTFARLLGLDGPAYPHLIFRSTEDIRPIPGAYNIGCFAWEFDVLSEPGLGQVPVFDAQTSMLGMCQEIWAPSRFTQSVLHAHGLVNCHFFPSPVFPPLAPRPGDRSSWEVLKDVLSCELVSTSSNFLFGYEADIESDYERLEARYAKPLGQQRRLRQVIETGGRIFTSVLNPYDKRKNLANLIDGFLLASQGRDDTVLVLKLITSGIVEKPAGYLYHQLRRILGHPHCIHEDRIILVGGYLTDEEMCALYNGSDFYLCASIAEGQNAPILEAMAHGCVPVSTHNTAMADYLDTDNSVVIAERRFASLIPELAGDVARRAYSVDFSDRYAIAEAITKALALPQAEVDRKAALAVAEVDRTYGVKTVTPGVLARLAQINPAARQARLLEASV